MAKMWFVIDSPPIGGKFEHIFIINGFPAITLLFYVVNMIWQFFSDMYVHK